MEQETIFVDGFISKDVNEKAPDFILGNASVNIDNLIKFLNSSRKYAVNGWLNWTIKRSKGGKRYTELDLYQFNKQNNSQKESQEIVYPENTDNEQPPF